MSIKLIVTDLDHTLLRRDKSVSAHTAEVFRRLRERGVLVAFATARYNRAVEEWLIPAIGIRPDVVISSNGAYACRGPGVLYRATLPPETGNRLVRAIHALGGAVDFATSVRRYCDLPVARTHASFSVPYDFAADIPEEFHYMSAHGLSAAAVARLLAEFPGVRGIRYSDVELVTFVAKDARKGAALAATAAKLGLAPAEILGFGDDRNDMDFMRVCGVSVAVSNAVDEIKALAGSVCGDCDEDGAANWLEAHWGELGMQITG